MEKMGKPVKRASKAENQRTDISRQTKLKRYLGCEAADFQSLNRLVKLFNAPVDASSLGIFRLVFG